MKSDIEIAKEVKPQHIKEVAQKLNIDEKYLEYYGNDKAKISLDILKEEKEDGKLVLVTSMNPTPYGEGKTTISIGLHDALCKLNKKSVATLREPSLGPVFGIKGGATGGGYAQVIPMEDINLHFTGDIHAITTCNNLLCAIVDSHIFNGNELNINKDEVYIKRCMDINDRALRDIVLKSGRQDHFQITTASEIMAILCLSKDLEDLRLRLGNILVGMNTSGKPVYAKELNCIDALLITLKDAIKPNLVQTLEHNPVIIHGGPFANIAHGCSSVIGTTLALKLADYVVTEAGFGADLGALKFFDIKGRVINKIPDVVVMNVTIRAIKHHGNNSINEGIKNVYAHLDNIKKFTNNIIVCINKFEDDSTEDIDFIIKNINYKTILVEAYKYGSTGALNLAQEIINMNSKSEYKKLYDIEDTIENKINIICKDIYKASQVEFSEEAINKINILKNNDLTNYPVCIAKTPYSISDDPKKLGSPREYTMRVTDISLSRGAGFIVVSMGNVMTMPGLSKEASYLNMKMDNEYNISGLR